MRGPSSHNPNHLLDTPADQNIGNGVIVQPQAGGATVIPQGNPERILMLSGPSSRAQTTSIILTASRIAGPNNPNPGFPGPITGVIEFGNGGQFTRVEVDIPIGPFIGFFAGLNLATEPQDGGVIVTVPTGVLRVYARYDNQLIQPILGPTIGPSISLAQKWGVPFVGSGGPKNIATPSGAIITPAEPVQVRAMAAYFGRHTSKVYRTQYIYIQDLSTGQNIPVEPWGYYCIPPFARSLKVIRQLPPWGTQIALNVGLYDNSRNLLEAYSIPAGPAPTIPLIGTETIVSVSPQVSTETVTLLAFCYEIGV